MDTLFHKENLSLLISSIALLVSGWSLYLNKRKFAIDKYNRSADFFLGISKIKEIVLNTENLRNTDPTQITLDKYHHDKVLIEELLTKYEVYENQIVKANYAIPDVILALKSTIKKLDRNFSGMIEHKFHTLEEEQVINYKEIFFCLSMLCFTIVNVNDGPNSEEQKLYTHFSSLSSKFDQRNLEIMQSHFNKTIDLMNEFTEKYLSVKK